MTLDRQTLKRLEHTGRVGEQPIYDRHFAQLVRTDPAFWGSDPKRVARALHRLNFPLLGILLGLIAFLVVTWGGMVLIIRLIFRNA